MPESLSDIGEFGLIECIHKLLKEIGIENPGVTLGMGDDAASIKPRSGYELLITCDSIIEGRHYLPRHIAPMDLGRRAMAVNISDIGAMGGYPLYALISLGLKPETPVKDVEDMYRGFVEELNPFEASIIGGNFTGSKQAIFIDITLIGEVKKENLMLRSSAQAGDAILVTGYPGQAAAGLMLLQRAKAVEKLSGHPLIRTYNVPEHRAREGHAIALSKKANAMIDTSDGFLADLGHICQESRLGAVLNQGKLPISPHLKKAAVQLAADPLQLFLGESDDYELIITCPPENTSGILSAIRKVSPVPVHEIGKITDAVSVIQWELPDGTRCPIDLQGWDHFRR